jgi:hypothetical protein
MQVFFFRTLAILLLITLDIAFVQVLVPAGTVVSLVWLAVISWTLILGFTASIWITIPLLFIMEAIFYPLVGPLVIFGLLLSAATAYFSLWVVQYKSEGFSWLWYAVMAAIGTLGWQIVANGWQSVMVGREFGQLLSLLLSALIFFPLVSGALSRMEQFLARNKQEAFQKIR